MPNANLCPVGKGGGAFRGDNGTELSGENGQSCFWFSQGCSIGCPEQGCELRRTRGSHPAFLGNSPWAWTWTP